MAGSVSSSSGVFGRRVDQDRDSDESVATSLFVEVRKVHFFSHLFLLLIEIIASHRPSTGRLIEMLHIMIGCISG